MALFSAILASLSVLALQARLADSPMAELLKARPRVDRPATRRAPNGRAPCEHHESAALPLSAAPVSRDWQRRLRPARTPDETVVPVNYASFGRRSGKPSTGG